MRSKPSVHCFAITCTHSSWTFSVCKFLKDSTGTCCTRVYIFSSASSSSLRLRDIRTRTRFGTLRTPLLQRNLFNLVSTRTSVVFIALAGHAHANLLWNIANAITPEELVQLGVNTDICGLHCACGTCARELALEHCERHYSRGTCSTWCQHGHLWSSLTFQRTS